jgi:hypothetical protein
MYKQNPSWRLLLKCLNPSPTVTNKQSNHSSSKTSLHRRIMTGEGNQPETVATLARVHSQWQICLDTNPQCFLWTVQNRLSLSLIQRSNHWKSFSWNLLPQLCGRVFYRWLPMRKHSKYAGTNRWNFKASWSDRRSQEYHHRCLRLKLQTNQNLVWRNFNLQTN